MATGGVQRITNWTAAEDAVVTERYPGGGVDACRRALPHRTPLAITNRAYHLGVRRHAKRGRRTAEKQDVKGAFDHRALATALGAPSGCSPRIVQPARIHRLMGGS